MKFKKALIAPAALLFTVAGLASCGGVKPEGPKFEPLTPTTEKPKGKVVFWSNIYFKNASEVKWGEDVVKEFNKIYPDIEVVIEQKGRYGDIDKEVQKNLSTPELLPNLVVGYPDFFTKYMDKLFDLRPYIEDEYIGLGKTFDAEGKVVADPTTDYNDFVKKYIDEGSNYEKEGMYSLPFGKTAEAFFINDTIFEDESIGLTKPTNWMEALDAAQKYIAKFPERFEAPKKGQLAPISFHSTSNLFITFSEMFGVPYASNVDTNGDGHLGKTEAVLFNNDKAKAMVKLFKQWFDAGLFTTARISEEQGGKQYVEDNFVCKDPSAIMIYDTTKGTSYVANSINKIQNEGKPGAYEGANHVSSAHPVLAVSPEVLEGKATPADAKSKVINQGGSIAFFDKGEENNKCAWLFYKFMTNTQFATQYTLANSTIPSRKSCYNDAAIADIIKGKDNVVTREQGWKEQFTKLNGQVFDLYKSYSENDQFYTAPVNIFSAKQRSACEDMFVQIMISTVKDEAGLDALINSEFQKAYNVI